VANIRNITFLLDGNKKIQLPILFKGENLTHKVTHFGTLGVHLKLKNLNFILIWSNDERGKMKT